MRFYFFTILMICSFSITQAQEEDADTLVYRVPSDIIVTATRFSIPLKNTPYSMNVVGQNIIKKLPRSISIDEPLRMVPGVKLDNQANGSRVHLSIRGQGILTERGIRGIKILYDGIPVNDPTGFAPDFFDIDFNTVDRIEVLRGAAASLHGGSGSGGIVNIITQNSPNKSLFGEANACFGSNGFWKGFGQFGGSVNDVNYRVSFSRMMGDGYRIHTHFWGDNFYGKATYLPTKSILLIPIFSWVNVYHENPEGIDLATYNLNPRLANPDAVPFNEYLQTERITNGFKCDVALNKNNIVEFVGYIRKTYFTEANNRTFNHRNITSPGSTIQYIINTGSEENPIRNRLSFGSDLQWQTIDEHRTDNHYSVEGDTIRSKERIEQRGIGLFLIDKVDFGQKLGAIFSLRHDNIRNCLKDQLRIPYDASGGANFKKTTASVGATFAAGSDMTVYSNWGQGFLPPATEELAQNPDNFGGFNKHITFATSNSIDVGLRGSLIANLNFDITAYYMKTQNDFDRYRIADSLRNQETFYRNAGASHRLGLELYGEYLLLKSLEIQVAYTYSHFKYAISQPIQVLMDDPNIIKYIENGNWLPNSPQHQLALDAQYKLYKNFSIGIGTETLSKAYIDGANIESEAVKGYTLVDARIIYKREVGGQKVEISLQALNIGNTKYVAFSEPDPGGNSYQPGPGREFFSGIRIIL
jgi:iron complex outermembrane receptor protein